MFFQNTVDWYEDEDDSYEDDRGDRIYHERQDREMEGRDEDPRQ